MNNEQVKIIESMIKSIDSKLNYFNDKFVSIQERMATLAKERKELLALIKSTHNE